LKRAELQKYIDDAMDCALSDCAAEKNPIIAWNVFISSLDSGVRRKIGDQMEQNGRNRYTGEPMTAEQLAEFKKIRKKLFAEIGIILEE
jgi:hypothetical protein